MIASYKDEDAERFAMGVRVRKFIPFERVALRKIHQLQVCASLDIFTFRQATALKH